MLKRFFVLAVSGLSLVLMINCGDNSTGPNEGKGSFNLNENAGTLDNHSGDNTPIKDSATAATVGSTVQSQSMEAGSKAMSLVDGGLQKIKENSVNGNIDGSINGTNSGTATAKGTYSYNETTGAVNYDITCTFNNYSEDGKLFMGGQIHYYIDFTFNQTSFEVSGLYKIDGKIRFNGSYMGTNTFSYDLNVTDESYRYTSTIVSDGVTTTINMSEP